MPRRIGVMTPSPTNAIIATATDKSGLGGAIGRELPRLKQGSRSIVTDGILGEAEADRLAKSFKALGDPTRMRLLSLIAASQGGEACTCDMTQIVGLTQPTVSHHMRQLLDAGLVTRAQRGKWAYYAIIDDALDTLSKSLTTSLRRGLQVSRGQTPRPASPL